MQKVAAKHGAREIGEFPEDLKAAPCPICGGLVVMCGRGPFDKRGTSRHAVELAPKGKPGNVAIETSLISCGPTATPCAYETNLPTRYRWHVCGGSFVGQARPRKVRP